MKRKTKLLVTSGAAICLLLGAVPVYTVQVKAVQLQETTDSQYYIFADSSQRILEYDDVCKISNADIRVAKNEIYARHGRKFTSADLQEYFSQMPWYDGVIEADQFDENRLNEIERANVSFLDQEYQKGTGSYNVSATNSIQLRLKGQSSTLQSAIIDDKIGLDSFEQRVSIQYKPDVAVRSEENMSLIEHLSDFYQRDGEFYGNIGYRKSARKVNGGNEYAWYDGHLYEAALESRQEANYIETQDLFSLYQDGLKIAWCWLKNDLSSGVQLTPSWTLTENYIYVSSYSDGMNVFDKKGNLMIQVPLTYAPFAYYNGRVYYLNHDSQIISADEGTLESQQLVFQDIIEVSSECGSHFIYKTSEGNYVYDMETGTTTWLGEAQGYESFVAGSDCIYEIRSDYSSGQCVIESCSYDGMQKETICILNGISYAYFMKKEGNTIYMNVSPQEVDFESPDGNMNQVSIAIDLESGIVTVLGADWLS